MNSKNSRRQFGFAVLAALIFPGCHLAPLMKPPQKISQDHFSCGEDCPHKVKQPRVAKAGSGEH